MAICMSSCTPQGMVGKAGVASCATQGVWVTFFLGASPLPRLHPTYHYWILIVISANSSMNNQSCKQFTECQDCQSVLRPQ
jgi:hypothetical protein